MLTYRTTLLLTQLKIDLLYSASRHDWKKMINLPCKSNLVLLIDTAVGVVGVELLNSLVGVSCWDERNSQVYSKRTRHKKKGTNKGDVPDQKDRLWHHQKRTHFFLCPSLCPLAPWVISADCGAQHVCPRPFLWLQSPSGSFRPPAHPPPPHRGRSQTKDLFVFQSGFRWPRLQILLFQ